MEHIKFTELVLSNQGKCSCTVIVSAEAPENVILVAKDFASLYFSMTGAEAPIQTDDNPEPSGAKVLIGRSRYTDALDLPKFTETDPETVLLKRIDDYLVLMGNDCEPFTGTQFAVTMFFERLGCGWFGPDELWQIIPRRDISVGYLDVCHRPQFVSRRNNVLQFFPEVGKRWYLGGEYRRCGHALTTLVPRETYFDQHPEWFCMVDGKRNPFVEWWQYCYSNEELIDVFAEKICGLFRDNPLMKQFSIAANDGWYHGFCECEECRKIGTTTDQVMHFANRLARKIAQQYPHHRLTVLAYFPTYRPPTRITRLEPNIEVMFCKETEMFAPVDKGPDSGYHLKYQFPESKNNYPVPWKDNFHEWLGKVTMEHICIWDWFCIAAAKPEWKDVPWVQGNVATRNCRFWHDHGVEYVYTDQGPLDVFYEDGNSFPLRWPLWYVSAKSWWDKDLTATDILMDACHKLYAESADFMLAVYLCMADIAQQCQARSIAWHPPRPSEVYTPEQVKRVDRLMEEAIRVPIPDERARQRIQVQWDLWQKAKETIREN